jgi:hypothetical protein
MNEKENIVNYPNNIDTRVALLEQSINHINQSLIEIKSNIKDMRSHFDNLIGGIYLMFGGSLLAVIYKLIHG